MQQSCCMHMSLRERERERLYAWVCVFWTFDLIKADRRETGPIRHVGAAN